MHLYHAHFLNDSIDLWTRQDQRSQDQIFNTRKQRKNTRRRLNLISLAVEEDEDIAKKEASREQGTGREEDH